MEGKKDHPVVGSLEAEIRPLLEIERSLEDVKREERSLMIQDLSDGDFEAAEEKGAEIFEDMKEYYGFVADVVELLQSRHVQRAANHQHEAFDNSDEYQLSRDHLERAKRCIETANSEMDKAKMIMDNYSHKLHEVKGNEDIFETLVNSFSNRKEQLEEVSRIQSNFDGVEPST